MTPDVTPLAVIGVNASPRIEHVTFLVFRNSLVLALHSLSCLAGYLARSEMPAEAARYRGWDPRAARPGRDARDRVRQRRDPFWLVTQALVLAHGASSISAQVGISPGLLLLTVLPHALPELTAVFLPLAAWILLSRQGRWDEMLAATLVTTAIAFPVVVLAAVVETYVSPQLLSPCSPGRTHPAAPTGARASLCIVMGPQQGASMAGTLQDVSDANFQAEVIESDAPVLVDFWAPWCGPCRVVAPVLEEIANERPELRIVKLNVDDNQQTAAAFDVLSIPTMILFKNGQVAKKIVGAYPKRKLEAEIEPVLA